MSDFLDRILSLRTAAKVGIFVGTLFLLGGGYYYFWYSDMIDEGEQIGKVIDQRNDEKKAYIKRDQERNAIRLEMGKLLDDQKELLRALPKHDDIEQFIENVNAQVELSGLTKVSSVRDAAVPEEMYLRIPIRMSLTGSYHQINRFFKNIGELKRIVTITDLQLTPVARTEKSNALNEPTALKADFVAQTFQFVDRPAPAAAPGPATPSAPANPGAPR